MITALPTLTVSAIFLAWNVCRRERERCARLLRERVAYMLWVATHHGDRPPDNDLDRRLRNCTRRRRS